MKANELRIGNWFQEEGKFYQLKSWMDGNYVNYSDNFETTYFDCEDIEPIHLTHDIVEMCGFSYHKRQTSDVHSLYLKSSEEMQDFYLEIDWIRREEGWQCYIEGIYGLQSFGIQIKYLHQLQNLYFALTGEELTVNLSEPVSLNA